MRWCAALKPYGLEYRSFGPHQKFLAPGMGLHPAWGCTRPWAKRGQRAGWARRNYACRFDHSAVARSRSWSSHSARSSMYTIQGDFWEAPGRQTGKGRSPRAARVNASRRCNPRYRSATNSRGMYAHPNSPISQKAVLEKVLRAAPSGDFPSRPSADPTNGRTTCPSRFLTLGVGKFHLLCALLFPWRGRHDVWVGDTGHRRVQRLERFTFSELPGYDEAQLLLRGDDQRFP